MEKKDQERLRLFVALQLPSELKDALNQLQRTLRDSAGDAVRWTPREQMHLTLLFLGSVPTSQLSQVVNHLQEACSAGQSLSLRAQGLGCFPDLRRPQVIWCGVEGQAECLQDFQKRVQNALRSWCEKIETRPYHPHLTLGRFRERAHAPNLMTLVRDAAHATYGEWIAKG